MASTNKTPNLELPQWELSDKPEMADFNDANEKIDTVVSTHLAESASKHITESGENETGSYIRFDDGTQIATIKSIETVTTSVYGTNLHRAVPGVKVYPANFIDPPALLNVDVRGSASFLCGALYQGTPITNINARLQYVFVSTLIDIELEVYITFIGRWKE